MLRNAYADMLPGETRFVLVAGEPGIGKTRLVEQLLTSVGSTEPELLWAQCVEWDGSPAYWPWIQAFRRRLTRLDNSDRQVRTGYGPPNIDQSLPSVLETNSSPFSKEPREPEQARFELFSSVAAHLENSTSKRPIVLVLDDLHWADAASLALLRFLGSTVRRIPLMIVATYRNSVAIRRSPLGETLASLAREPGHRRIVLGGLARNEVRQFVEQSLSSQPDETVIEAIQHAADGNAFFMNELVRLHANHGSRPRTDESLRIPESVRDVIRQRLDQLSDRGARRLTLASVIGREFGLSLLARVANEPIEVILAEIDEAAAAGLIEEVTPDVFRFNHALVQDALYDSLPAAERPRVHGQIARELESRSDGDPATISADLARHFGLAAPAGLAPEAVQYAMEAASFARAQHAWESEIEHCKQALKALEWSEAPEVGQHCDILLALGDAETRAGKGRESAMLAGAAPDASATYAKAIRLARSADLPERFARGVLGFAGPKLGAPQSRREGLSLMHEALAKLPNDDSDLRARLLARISSDAWRLRAVGELTELDVSRSEIIQRSNEAVAMARRIDDIRLLAYALEARFQARDGPDHVQDQNRDAEELWRIAQATDDPEITEWSCLHRYEIAVESGQRALADHLLEELARLCARRRLPRLDLTLTMHQTGRAIRHGQFTEAEALIARSQTLWPRTAVISFQLTTLRWEQDRIAEVEDLIRTRLDFLPNQILWRAIKVTLKLETGDERSARAEFNDIAAAGFTNIPREVFWLRTMSWLAYDAAMLADAERARQIYDLLSPYRDHNTFILSNSDQTGGSVSYYLGLLATTMEKWELADQHFREALERNERWEIWPYAAHTRYGWAAMLLQRGRPEDLPLARELLQHALEAAEQMGMSRLARISRETNDRLTFEAGGEDPGARHGLSMREIEVLRLVTEGLSDRAIADALFISPRTVGSHVSHILTKLCVATRAEAAVVAVRRQMV